MINTGDVTERSSNSGSGGVKVVEPELLAWRAGMVLLAIAIAVACLLNVMVVTVPTGRATVMPRRGGRGGD